MVPYSGLESGSQLGSVLGLGLGFCLWSGLGLWLGLALDANAGQAHDKASVRVGFSKL